MKKLSKYVVFSVLTGVVLGLIKFFSIIPFGRMAADDFSYADMAKRLGFFGAEKNWYINWTGRFTSTFLQMLFSLMSGVNSKTLIYSLVTLGVFIISLLIIFRKISVQKNILYIVTFSLISLVSLYVLTPNKSESWYWLSGSVTYLWPIIFLVFVIGIVLIRNYKIFSYVLASLFLFLAVGGNETVATLIVVVTMGFLTYSFCAKKMKPMAALLFLVSWGSFAVVYFAPGNRVRLVGGGSNPMSLGGAILYSLQTGPSILYSIFAGNYLFILTLFGCLAYLFSTFKSAETSLETSISKTFIAMSLPVFLSVIYVLPAFKTLGRIPPDRSDITLAFILLVSLEIAAFYLGQVFALLRAERFPIFRLIISGAAFLFIFSSFRIESSLGTDFYIARSYSLAYDNMISLLRIDSLKHIKGTITVPKLPENGLIPSVQIKGYPDNWTNRTVAEYYGLSDIVSK